MLAGRAKCATRHLLCRQRRRKLTPNNGARLCLERPAAARSDVCCPVRPPATGASHTVALRYVITCRPLMLGAPQAPQVFLASLSGAAARGSGRPATCRRSGSRDSNSFRCRHSECAEPSRRTSGKACRTCHAPPCLDERPSRSRENCRRSPVEEFQSKASAFAAWPETIAQWLRQKASE